MITLGKVLLLRHLQALHDLSIANIYRLCYVLVGGIKQGLASYMADSPCTVP